MDIQLKAYTENDRLFRPEKGITYSKLLPGESSRASIILDWISKHDNHNTLIINVLSVLDKITFNVSSNLFEEGFDELGEILGFSRQRPEKVTGNGPDNFWHIRGKEYWVIECKNMVTANRGISKTEAGQLNTSIAWFKKNYDDSLCVPIFIHKARVLEKDAFVTDPVWVLPPEELDKLKTEINKFYNSLKEFSFDNLSLNIIDRKLKENHLGLEDLKNDCLVRVKDNRKMK